MSQSIEHSRRSVGGREAKETAKFVLMFDKFFDALNVRNFCGGIYHRKPFQSPYYSETDFRLTVSTLLCIPL